MRLSTQGASSTDDINSGLPKEGKYHAFICDVDESFTKSNDAIIVQFQILAGTEKDQAGLRITQYYNVKREKSLARLAMAVGLIGPNVEEQEVRFEDARGRMLVIDVKDHEWTKEDESTGEKKTHKRRGVSENGVWEIDHPAVKDVPKDQESMTLLDQPASLPAGAPAPASTPTSASTPAPVAAAVTMADDEFAGL